MTNLQIAREWLQGMNEHDVEKMFRLCTEDLIGDEVAEPEPHVGRAAVKESYVDLFNGFPDCKAEILNELAGDDQVLIEIRWTGTNTGEFRGTPATGKPVDVRIAYIFKFRDGKICSITEYYDAATVVAQMGL